MLGLHSLGRVERREIVGKKHVPMSPPHFLEAFPLLRSEIRNRLLMGLIESCRDALAGFLANDFELRRGPVNNRRDLRRLFRSESQFALQMRAHALSGAPGMSSHENKVGVPRAGKKARRHTGEEDDDQCHRQLPSPALHHCKVPASITVSAMA